MFTNLADYEVAVTNASAWAFVNGPSSRNLVQVYSDKDTGLARVKCYTDSGVRQMSAEEYGFDHSLLTDIERITDGELIKRLGTSPIARDFRWHAGPWCDSEAADIGVEFRKKKESHANLP